MTSKRKGLQVLEFWKAFIVSMFLGELYEFLWTLKKAENKTILATKEKE